MKMIFILTSLLTSFAFAQTPTGTAAAPGKGGPGGGPKQGPCMQIENDCKAAGYVAGEAGQGKGLWWDCMCPLIAQNFPEPSQNVLKVPSDSALVSSCRQHPHGQKIMSNCANMLAKKNAKAAAKGAATPAPGH